MFGPDPSVPLPARVGDDTLPAPKTSYGTHKLICEHLVADYSRKGFIDGRSARLMTVTGASGSAERGQRRRFFPGSSASRWPARKRSVPSRPRCRIRWTSVARTVEGLIAVYEADIEALGGRLALNLPAVNATVGGMLDALEAVAGRKVRERVRFVRDERIASIVANWPGGATAERANRLGLRADADFAAIVRQYIDDCRRAPGGDAALKGMT